ncbi:Nuclear pore complex protein Nup153 [Strongyloides ratti]|uniref:Nuclear pore complex protein Nup153 n=1 Tax=Strongyloides ratti TaxID=34506 RepID=A0A090LI30_STRRB|nr:Nuclear pore complex protein Nup153 [Strongyloides ratti]CEF67788.1 Nuclear pore complex protein Nup153 [Strongyloides ratti]
MNSPNDKSNSGWYKSLCRYINSINSVKSEVDSNLEEHSDSDSTKFKSPIKDNKKNFTYLTPKVDRLSDGKFKGTEPSLDYKSVFKSNTRKRPMLTPSTEIKTGLDRKWLKLNDEVYQDYVHVDTPFPFVKNSRLLDHSNDVEENNIKIKLIEDEKDLLRRSISHIVHEEVRKIADLDDKGPFGCLSKRASPSMFAYTASNRSMNERKSLFTPTRAHLLATNVSKTSFSRWNKPLKLNGKSHNDNVEKNGEKGEEKKTVKRKNVFSANFDDEEIFEPKISKKDANEDSVVLVQKPKVTNLAYTFSNPLNRGPLCSKCKVPIENKEIPDSEVSAASSPDYSKEVTTEVTFPSKPKSKLWSCQACYVNNSEDKNECDCCKTPKGETLPVSAPSKDWSCPDCMVKNKEADLKCVCCTAAKPGTKTEGNKKWTCETCLVPNDGDKDNCVCCDTPRASSNVVAEKPAPKTLKATTFTPTTGNFTFGFSAGSVKNNENNSNIFGTLSNTTTNTFENSNDENINKEKDSVGVSMLNGNGLASEKESNKESSNFSFGLKPADSTTTVLKSPNTTNVNLFSSSTVETKTIDNTSTIFGTPSSSKNSGVSSVVTQPATNNENEVKNTASFLDNSTKNSTSTNSFFATSFKQQNPTSTSIFGTQKPNESTTESIFGASKPVETSSTSLFGSSISAQPNNVSVVEPPKQSLFSMEKKNEIGSNVLFGTKTEGGNSLTSPLFGSHSQQPISNTNSTSLFGSAGNNGTASSSGLFGQNASSSGTANSLFQSPFSQPLTNNVPSNPFGSSVSTNNSTTTSSFGTSASTNQQPSSGFNFGFNDTVQANRSVGFNFGLQTQNNSTTMGNPNEIKGFDFGSAPQSFDFGNRSSSFQFGSTNPVANVFSSSSPASSAAPSPIVGRRIAQAKRKGVRRM